MCVYIQLWWTRWLKLFAQRVTFEFVEKVRKSFTEADTDNTGYLDVSEFTAFMRQTYSDMTDREAQIIFMKVWFFLNTHQLIDGILFVLSN